MKKNKNSLQIIMLIPELGYGGAEKSFLRLCYFLSKFHNVQIVVFKRHYAQGNYSKLYNKITLPLIILDKEKKSGKFKRWKNRWKKLKELKKQNDVCISFLTGANILNVSVFSICKTVISMRGSRQFDPNISFFKRILYMLFIDPITFMFSDKIISISDGLTYEFKKYVPNKIKEKIQTIEIFVNAEELISIASSSYIIEKELEKLKGQPIIITAGRLSKEKGFQYLIPIFAKVYNHLSNAKLILIGDGPQYKELINLCKTLKLPYTTDNTNYENSAIIFLGYKKDPLRYFHIAKIFVLSSLTEGFSNSIIEALASGIHVISADCPWGPRSILCKKPKDVKTPYPTTTVREVEYGILMPRIDNEKFKNIWKDKLVASLLDTSNNTKISSLGLQRVRELDVSIVGEKWLKIIDDIHKIKKV